MTVATDAAVELRGVRKSYRSPAGPVRVLDDVDLSIAPGEVVALSGRSGSGKTTLLTIVAGWDEPDAGTTMVLGADAARPHAWRDMGILPQSLGLLDELTIAENVTLPIRLARARHALEPDTIMTRLGIDHLADRYPREVSLGEQQRAALARAVVLSPRLLIADEPIAHQNHGWAEGMMLVVAELAAQGACCLIATHNEVAFASADRVLELHAGRLRPQPDVAGCRPAASTPEGCRASPGTRTNREGPERPGSTDRRTGPCSGATWDDVKQQGERR